MREHTQRWVEWLYSFSPRHHHRRYAKHHTVETRIMTRLQFVEYPKGEFLVYIKQPRDLVISFEEGSYDAEVRLLRCDDALCQCIREVIWKDVTIFQRGRCRAPSIERLSEALSHMTIHVGYQHA